MPFTADDVIFTEQMLVNHAPDLGGSASFKEWVAKIEKVDDLTVKFTLTKPNPRFQLDFYSVKIWGGGTNVIVPKHIWEGQDPLTFKFYDPAKGWPVGTGAYKLDSVSPTEFSYLRNDNWWGAKTGFKPLPAPKKLIWTWAGPEETRTALMADNQLDSLMDITPGRLAGPADSATRTSSPGSRTCLRPGSPIPAHASCRSTIPWRPGMTPRCAGRSTTSSTATRSSTSPTKAAPSSRKHFFPAYPPLDRIVKLADRCRAVQDVRSVDHGREKGPARSSSPRAT